MPKGQRLQMPVENQVQCILEGFAGVRVEELCRRYGLSQSQYYRLRDRFLEGGKAGLTGTGRDAERASHESQIADLERVVGRLTVENQALKKTLH
jgi:transposase-like protein